MKIIHIRAIAGPNVFSHKPVLVMRLDLEELTGKESYEVPGFIERLLHALPGVHDHYCGKGYAGGFVERLHEGTYFGHIVEHVCLELTDRVGIPVNRGKTVRATSDSVYDVAVEYRSEAGMRKLLEIAVEYVQALIDAREYPLDERIAEAIAAVEQAELGPSTRAMVDAAEARGIPWTRISEGSLVQLGQGIHRRFLEAALSSETSAVAVDVASDKALTKVLLDRASVPAPRGVVVENEEDAVRAWEEAACPVVVKPLDANQGKGVSLALQTGEQVREAFRLAAAYSRRVVVEEMLRGRDYRLLVVGGKMIAASERRPAQVTGDGGHMVAELVQMANRDPRRGDGHGKPLSTMRIDEVTMACLKRQGLTADAVPRAGQVVWLRDNANLSTGGTAIDVTDVVHENMRLIAERAAKTIGLDICGVDLVTPDISQPFTEGGVVEVNAAPGLRMHEHPCEGKPRPVAAEIIRMLYPAGDGRIPIVSVTGTNGKTTTTRLIGHILAASGKRIGMTTTDGIWVGGRKVASGDTTGPRSAQAVLFDPEVEMAVLETARGGIVRNGLGYDWSDVGVMTNISADHIGQDGIESLDDILRIKSLVAERVREGGVLVLNADDPLLRGVPQRPKVARLEKRMVWFAMDAGNALLERVREAGGTVYAPEDGVIFEWNGQSRRRVVDARTLAFTFGGAAAFQVANVMAAVAACRALGTGVAQIRAALRSFDSGVHNPARANLYAVNGGYLLFDYGHNPQAIEAIAKMAAAWPASLRTCVVGLPGDRSNEVIEESARAVARGFERVVVREDEDTRGRERGELARLIAHVIRRENSTVEIQTIIDEGAAVRAAVRRIRPGELVVAFCDRCEEVCRALQEAGAVRAASFAGVEEGEKVLVA